jgi:hypothetical protein
MNTKEKVSVVATNYEHTLYSSASTQTFIRDLMVYPYNELFFDDPLQLGTHFHALNFMFSNYCLFCPTLV